MSPLEALKMLLSQAWKSASGIVSPVNKQPIIIRALASVGQQLTGIAIGVCVAHYQPPGSPGRLNFNHGQVGNSSSLLVLPEQNVRVAVAFR